MAKPAASTPRRLPREQRTRQLLDISWMLIGAEGTDALTLGRLAEAAGVTKPVVYDHFGTRNGLLVALYEDYDQRQTAIFEANIAAARPELFDKSAIIARCYVDCVMLQGREIPGVLAALNGSAELAKVKRRYQHAFIEKCAAILSPFCAPRDIPVASLWAMLGAADALSEAAVTGDISPGQAKDELQQTIIDMLNRTSRSAR